jgi:hypothetical protein
MYTATLKAKRLFVLIALTLSIGVVGMLGASSHGNPPGLHMAGSKMMLAALD